MDDRFFLHNLHWQSLDQFLTLDPQLRTLDKQPFVYNPPILYQLPIDTPGIYTLGGGRQIGKTTLLKQWMALLLKKKIHPKTIFFLTGEMIQDHFSLVQTIQTYIEEHNHMNVLLYIIIDETTYIKDWDQGVKFLADSGVLENVIMMLTGSNLNMMQDARMRFPGRRGVADVVDFHLYPLSFFECVQLKVKPKTPPSIETLFQEFDAYLQHGGFLTAINSIARNGDITASIYRTYSDWIRSDVVKRGKNEGYLKDFLIALFRTYGSQVTWNALADHMMIDHPQTIQSYAQFLEPMDVLFIQPALMEDKLLAAPKKAKKLILKDPFIYHAIHAWLYPMQEKNPFILSHLVESSVISHYQRYYPCFYIKAEGEVDLAYVDQNKFFPIEVKWTNVLRPKDLKQIKKYPNALILTKTNDLSAIGSIKTEPLPVHLYELGQRHCLPRFG